MKTVAAAEMNNRWGAILDEAEHDPIVIRRQDRDIAVVFSMADCERLRAGNIQALLRLWSATKLCWSVAHRDLSLPMDIEGQTYDPRFFISDGQDESLAHARDRRDLPCPRRSD